MNLLFFVLRYWHNYDITRYVFRKVTSGKHHDRSVTQSGGWLHAVDVLIFKWFCKTTDGNLCLAMHQEPFSLSSNISHDWFVIIIYLICVCRPKNYNNPYAWIATFLLLLISKQNFWIFKIDLAFQGFPLSENGSLGK